MTLRVPLVASFHTDLIDLLSTHGAYEFQKGLVITKEAIDSLVMDSCATTSKSFQVGFSLFSLAMLICFALFVGQIKATICQL